MPDIAVVITAFNRPAMLAEAIASVMAQTLPARQVIVVDDGSTEDVRGVVERFPGVLYRRQANAGPQAARNLGFQLAETEWVATLDDDDLFRSGHLAAAAQAIDGCDAEIVFSDHHKFTERGPAAASNFAQAPADYWEGIAADPAHPGWVRVGRFPLERLLRFNAFYPSSMIVRKALWDAVGRYDPAVRGIRSEDMHFLIRALAHGSLAVVWDTTVDYRIHTGNATASISRRVLGRWKLFELAAADAHMPASFHRALTQDLPRRRADAFDMAFVARDFAALKTLSAKLRPEDWTMGRRLKSLAAQLPDPLVQLAGQVAGKTRRPRL